LDSCGIDKQIPAGTVTFFLLLHVIFSSGTHPASYPVIPGPVASSGSLPSSAEVYNVWRSFFLFPLFFNGLALIKQRENVTFTFCEDSNSKVKTLSLVFQVILR